MKFLKGLLITCLLIFTSLQAQAIGCSITHCTFYHNNTSFTEFYFGFSGQSVYYNEINEGIQSEIELTYFILNELDSIIHGDKIKITSPMETKKRDFWQKLNLVLPSGRYQLEANFVDKVNLTNTKKIIYPFEIAEKNLTKPYVSSPFLIRNISSKSTSRLAFDKNGISFEPAAYNSFGESDVLHTYLEIYNSNLMDSGVYLAYKIYEGRLNNPGKLVKKVFQRISIKDKVIPIAKSINIDNFLSGNYHLRLQLRSEDKTLIDESIAHFNVKHPIVDNTFFSQSNQLFETSFVQDLNDDEVNYALRALRPRVLDLESEVVDHLIKGDDYRAKRYYIYTHWSQESIDHPEIIYEKYMTVARAIDFEYGNNVGPGFETDRGYIFLKYGRPHNIITEENEPTAPPYEIWIYEYLPETFQSNVKFLFYNPSLSGSDFVLLHSTCTTERNNPQWEIELYNQASGINNQTGNTIDQTSAGDGWGRNARRYFQDN